MKMNKKINFGVVGIGHIGRKHLSCINNNKLCQLIAICDKLSFDKIEGIEIEAHKDIFFNSIDSLLNNPTIDVVSICTPNFLHAPMALKCLNSRKHVIIEKPMALSTVDAQSIMKKSKEVGRHVFCVMQNRFSPTISWLKDIIKEEALGKINFVQVNCFWNRNLSYYNSSDWHGRCDLDGGPLYTQFSHFIDIIYWLFGDFSNIESNFFKFNDNSILECEDSGLIRFNLQKDIFGSLMYSTSIYKKNFESSIIISGNEGTVKIGGQYMDKLEYCDINNYKKPNFDLDLQCNDYGSYKGSAANHAKIYESVLEALFYNKEFFIGVEEGKNVVNIIEQIYKSRKINNNECT